MSIEPGREVKSRVSPSASPTEAAAEGHAINTPNAFPKLKSPAPRLLLSPSPCTMQNDIEVEIPSSSSAAVLSPVSSPRGPLQASTPLAQDSVSVVVRLKGAPAAVAGPSEKLSSPSSLTSSPRRVALLDYAVEDGTLRTPRIDRRLGLRNSSVLSPRGHLNTSFGGSCGDGWAAQQQEQEQPSQKSSLLTSDSFDGLPTLTVSVTLPKASPSQSKNTSATATQTITMAKDGVKNRAGVGHLSRGGGSVGCSIRCLGRVLTIRAPSSDDCRQYEFGEIFEPSVTNTALCERMLPAIMEQLEAGYNACVLCYGQTGSGKTYTMNALAPAISAEIFRRLDSNNEVVEMSYIQIYNNKAYSLLDSPRGSRFGAELSKPQQTTANSVEGNANAMISNNNTISSGAAGTISSNSCSSGVGGGYVNGVFEPKVLVRSAADVLARMRSAARLRVTHAHALNPRSSRSFTLLTLHVTHFVDGAPLTTTRVTLADLAGTERLKKSGATGEGQSQAIFINKSLMALRELIESNNTETEVLHFRDSLLTTYLAPRMRSWHLFLLVTVSLEVGNYEETKSSLDFATNARRRKIKKVKSRTADRISGSAFPRLTGVCCSSSVNSARSEAEVGDLQAVIEVLQYRISVLEESLKVAQLQRSTLVERCTPLPSPAADEALFSPRTDPYERDDANDNEYDNDGDDAKGPQREGDRLRQCEVQINQLCQECRRYRQLLREREDELRGVQAQMAMFTNSEASPGVADASVSPIPSGHLHSGTNNNNTTNHSHQHHRHDHPSYPLANGIVNEIPQRSQPFLSTPHSSIPTSVLSGDANPNLDTAGEADAEDKNSPATTAITAATITTVSTGNAATILAAEDAHVQLLRNVLQLRSRLLEDAGLEAALDCLHDVALRAKEQNDDVREWLLVLTSTLAGLRRQNHQLCDDVLRGSRAALEQDEKLKHFRKLWAQERLRSKRAVCAVEQLRLQLFRAYTEQTIGEELTRLYLDEQPPVETVDTLSGTQLAEHRVEMEKFESHQRALQDKITELVNTVEQLTRAGSQKDVSLAALESIITPAQRTLFQTMSSIPLDGYNGASTATAAAAVTTAVNDDGVGTSGTEASAADCLSLLRSRVSELELLLQQERQQHRLTQCEVVEAREDARRSRQEQRQSFFQQQEEERRAAQLAAENYDLRQQNERHQMYLDQVHVHFQEQLLELRRYHVAEMAEQCRLLEEAQRQHEQFTGTFTLPASRRGGQEDKVNEDDGTNGESIVGEFCQTSTRRGTPHGPLHGSRDWTTKEMPVHSLTRPASQRTSGAATAATEESKRKNSSTMPQFHTTPSLRAQRNQKAPTAGAASGKESRRRDVSGKKRRHTWKLKGKADASRGKRSSTETAPAT